MSATLLELVGRPTRSPPTKFEIAEPHQVDRIGGWIARIAPEELLGKLHRGDAIALADLRHPLDFGAARVKVPGALRLLPEELDARHSEIPRDRDVVLLLQLSKPL